jgi:glycosyltransferase involved in cell wall biosynthesis
MIDVLMATYNGEDTVASQLDSLLAQSHKDWQLILRDDGSQDRTLRLCHQYAAKHPDKVRIIEDSFGNLGVNKNYETLLRHSASDYVMFCDQDDMWLPDKIALTHAKMLEAERLFGPEMPILVYTDLKVADAKLNVVSDSFLAYTNRKPNTDSNISAMCMANCTIGCTMMLNKRLRSLVAGFPEGILIWDWWLALVAVTFGKLVFLNQATIVFRRHNRNTSTVTKFDLLSFVKPKNVIKKHRKDLYAIFENHRIFYESFARSMTPAQQRLFRDISSIPSRNWAMRRYLIFRYRLFKTGWVKNLGMLLTI